MKSCVHLIYEHPAVIVTVDVLNASRGSVGVYGKSGISVFSSKEMPNTIDMI